MTAQCNPVAQRHNRDESTRDEARTTRIREILASWPATTEQQRTQAVAILATAGRAATTRRLVA